jgi:hypothetical protein
LLLFLLQVLIPNISFVGHLSGVIGGLVVVFGLCQCCFPAKASMIAHVESPDSYLHSLSLQSSYVNVDINQPEGFISGVFLSTSDSPQHPRSEEEWQCFRICHVCKEQIVQLYSRFGAAVLTSHEYEAVSTDILPSTVTVQTSSSSGSSTSSGSGSRHNRDVISEQRSAYLSEAEDQKDAVRAIRLAKYSAS